MWEGGGGGQFNCTLNVSVPATVHGLNSSELRRP